MPRRPDRAETPLIRPSVPLGRPADRIAAGLAMVAGLGAVAATIWFFSGFLETDPAFGPASSAFLLSLGLGAFGILPAALITKLAWAAWRRGFRPAHGLWTLFLCGPWIGLAVVSLRSDWLPLWLGLGPLLIAVPLILWAVVSLWLERPGRPKS